MDGIIVSRFILFVVLFCHVLLGYAGPALFKHIKAKVYDALFATEILALTGYIVYDNIVNPIQIGWGFAVLGYLFVYGAVVLTWIAFSPLTIDPKKAYQLRQIEYKIRILNDGVLPSDSRSHLLGVDGMIRQGWRTFHVICLDEEAYQEGLTDAPVYVRFKTIASNGTIFVTRVKESIEMKGMWAC